AGPHEDEYAIDRLADAVADSWQEGLENCEDPFDIYVHERRIKLSSDRYAFRGRLRRGYRSILSILCEDPEKNVENT
ncbi:MAG: hypothetical protein H0U49_08245, partial [Parachlamydiaceae bacterium]|nr:hypothetical protein [Parachlamydiaceae bacterium]